MKTCQSRNSFLSLWALALLCGAAQMLTCRPALAGGPVDAGSDFDFSGVRGHVDIPEIAGVPGGGGSWLPPILSPLSPDDPLGDVRSPWPLIPIPIPGDLPSYEDPVPGQIGPGVVLPDAILPGGFGSSTGAIDSGPSATGTVPSPGAAALLVLGLATAGGRRRR